MEFTRRQAPQTAATTPVATKALLVRLKKKIRGKKKRKKERKYYELF
jgi:hypothetical protein